MAQDAISYENALKAVTEVSNDGFLPPETSWIKVVLFFIMKKIFKEPYDGYSIFEEAETVMLPDEVIELRRTIQKLQQE